MGSVRGGWALGAVAIALAVGCGAKTGLKIPEPPPRDAGPPRLDAPIDAPLPPLDASPPECTVLSATAQLLPLDVFMLFDASGSMQEPGGDGGGTKWRAVRRAVSRFFMDPLSGGIGIALTFFPHVRAEVPLLCSADATCGAGGPCGQASACPTAGNFCNTRLDCALRGFPDDPCTPLGYCAGGALDEICTLDGSYPCFDGRACLPLGACDGRDTCEAAAYQTPAHAVELLPEAARRLLRTYDAHEVSREAAGGTPTLPAVAGTVRGAVSFARANPTHKVVVVVATDGLPTTCDPDLRTSLDAGVANIAREVSGALAEGGVETFVIGVFAPVERDLAELSLDRIAAAGGTERAFIVDASGGLTDEFVEALNQVRLDATACDFALSEPLPLDGEPIWARITDEAGEETWLPRVGGPAECARGGFYFPDAGAAAERVALCPSSCTLLGSSPDRELELFTICPEDPTGP